MRRSAWFLLLLLLPTVAAGPGHSGGLDAINPTAPYMVELSGAETKGGPVSLWPGGGTNHFVFSGHNQGPSPVLVEVFIEEAVVRSFVLPPDDSTRVEHMVFETTDMNLSIDFTATAPSSQNTTLRFFADYTDCRFAANMCRAKLLPCEVQEGAVVFRHEGTGPGTYRTTIVEPELHDLWVEVRSASTNQLLGSTSKARGLPESALEVEWTLPADDAAIITVTSLTPEHTWYPAEGYRPAHCFKELDHMQVFVVHEGPIAKATPAPMGIAMLALAVAARFARNAPFKPTRVECNP